jgi:hypothetical protein
MQAELGPDISQNGKRMIYTKYIKQYAIYTLI